MSKYTDRDLGMERPVSRRDVLHGFGAVAASTFVPGYAFADAVLAAETAGGIYYPPALTGMRGNHDGSFDVSHSLALGGKRDWGPVERPDAEVYDLVVVGAGLSGLAAAHFYRKDNPQARILLLENHDDFGGHAKRNEFDVGGRTHIGYGGSQSFEDPSSFPGVAKSLLRDLGIDMQRLAAGYDQEFYKRNGLGAAVYFDRENWGVDRLVHCDLGHLSYIPLAPSDLTATKAVSRMPMSDAAKVEFLRLLTTDVDQIPEISADDKEDYLYSITYREFLEKHLDIHAPEVFAVLQDLAADFGAGIDAVAAGGAMGYSELPGARAAGYSVHEESEPYIYHFPDGNTSVARMMVRNMIPDAAPGSTMDDIVTAAFDYSELDRQGSAVRLRLNSTVVHVEHEGDPKSAKQVGINYVKDGRAYRVQARHCVLACYNSIIPHIVPDLPAPQREALSMQVKTPMLYTNVVLRNWRAWKQLGIGGVTASGSYHVNAMLDFPISIGDYKFGDNPDDPITVHMERFPHRNNEGLSPREQRRLGRHELLATSFETMERNIRSQMAGMLSASDFDPARDIAGITVNRWAHGYADSFNDFGDPWYGGKNDERYPHVRGRKQFGRIAIANSDSGASAMLESAVRQAYRAIGELRE